MRKLLIIAIIGLTPAWVRAEVRPNALCGEGMVLQQKAPAKIWGGADKGEKVEVTFRGKSAAATADDMGRWIIDIPAGDAGGPFEMTIKGNNTILYKNVLVGEVWICSGQSNMEWTVGGCDKTDKDYASKAPHNPMLRMFKVKKNPQAEPLSATAGTWTDAKPETVNSFSAVGYFFGRNLQEDLKVPVGMIDSSWGGTRIETWMSKEALESVGIKDPPKKLSANSASALYNGMIYPFLNYRVKGAIWYQGESNASQAFKYRTLLPRLIENWRADFKNADLPFYFVQLAPFGMTPKVPGDSAWAELREAQTMSLKVKNTGMAVITDFGNEYDIHPTPKRPVGDRLALAARAQTYGEKIVYSGPMFDEVKFEGKKAILSFTHIAGGLVSKKMVPTLPQKPKKDAKKKDAPVGPAWRVKEGAKTAPLIGFTVCGKDMVFEPAKAEIVGDTVVVSSDRVDAPIAVRYGWANHPICNLFNREGLPASPFRTDTFPGSTQPK
jgi:sialate O-acetylesterase